MTDPRKIDPQREEERQLLARWEELSEARQQQLSHLSNRVKLYVFGELSLWFFLSELEKQTGERPELPARMEARRVATLNLRLETMNTVSRVFRLLGSMKAAPSLSSDEPKRTEFQARLEAMLRTTHDEVMRNPRALQRALLACIAVELESQLHRFRFIIKRVQGLQGEWERDPERVVDPDEEKARQAMRGNLSSWWKGWRGFRDLIRDLKRLWYGPRQVPQHLDVNALLREVLSATHARHEPTVRLVTDFAPGLPRVHASRAQLWLVFHLLVRDALLAMKGDPPGAQRLELRTRAEEGWVRVDISDTGKGLSAECLPHLFEPFCQGGRHPDTGLRLSACEALVERLGGRLLLRDASDRNVTFSVLLPSGAGEALHR
jgi:signal transduction histidine kinase